MNSHNQRLHIKKYIITCVTAFIFAVTMMALRRTFLIDVNIARQFLMVLPIFFFSIGVCFLLISIIHFIQFPLKETRILYYIIYAFFVGIILYQYFAAKLSNTNFDVFQIIAAASGLYVVMVLHDHFSKVTQETGGEES